MKLNTYNAFINSYHNYLLIINSVPGIKLGSWNISINKSDRIPDLVKSSFWLEGIDNKHNK